MSTPARGRNSRAGQAGRAGGQAGRSSSSPPASQPPARRSHETPSRTPKTGPRHRASHRDAAEPGDGPAPSRAPDDDGAAGQGAASFRGAAHHDRQARAWPTAQPIKTLNARRLVMQDLQDREVVTKLFDTLAPRFASRAGGYTRLLRLGFRTRRRGRDRAGRAGRQRVQPQGQGRGGGREGREHAEAEGRRRPACVRRPIGSAARRTRIRCRREAPSAAPEGGHGQAAAKKQGAKVEEGSRTTDFGSGTKTELDGRSRFRASNISRSSADRLVGRRSR